MSTETTHEDLDAAFDGGFDGTQPATPAADSASPQGQADADTTQAQPNGDEGDDDLAGLPPKVRAMLDKFQQLEQAVAAVPGLEQRLRKTEGRIGDLNTRLPAPPPPAPPKLEKVERVRAELPEVAEAIEEFVQHHLKATPAADKPAADGSNSDTPVLAEAFPDWEVKVASDDFAKWLDTQQADYAQRVKTTTSEAVMLQALTRYETAKEFERQRASEANANAQRVAQTRQSRASAAAVPAGAGRRAPAPASTLDDAFEAGFNGT